MGTRDHGIMKCKDYMQHAPLQIETLHPSRFACQSKKQTGIGKVLKNWGSRLYMQRFFARGSGMCATTDATKDATKDDTKTDLVDRQPHRTSSSD